MLSPPRKRVPRASVADIYNTCSKWGTCPPDVKNKVEQTTVADWILKIGSALAYFGGLGISTSSGKGSQLGYQPISTAGSSVRPSVVRPPISTSEPIELSILSEPPVDAQAPSVITLTDATVDPSVINSADNEGIVTISSTSDFPPSIEINKNEVVTTTTHSNPHYDPALAVNPTSTSHSAVNIHPSSTTNLVGVSVHNPAILDITESIELDTFSGVPDVFEYDVETPVDSQFATSTPTQGSNSSKQIKFTSKQYTQTEVHNPIFLSHPESLMHPSQVISNVDTSLEWTLDSNVGNASQPEFQDIFKLSAPVINRIKSGHVRVSRVGYQSSMQTRQGTVIGPVRHYYYDLSSISEVPESIEMQVINDNTGNTNNGGYNFDNVSLTPSLPSIYSDEELLDPLENFDHSHLVIGSIRRQPVKVIPYTNVTLPAPFAAIYVDFTHSNNENFIDSVTPSIDSSTSTIAPPNTVPNKQFVLNSNFLWSNHPSLILKKKKKKRKHPYLFHFADDTVAPK